MKKILQMLILPLLLCIAVSCEKNKEEASTLTVDKQTLTFGKSAEEKSVSIITDADIWTAIANEKWVTLTQSAQSLNIAVEKNEKLETRTATIWIMAGDMTQKVEITQSATDVILTIDPQEIIFDAQGGDRTIDVISNVHKWTADTDADWFTVQAKPYKGELVINVAAQNDMKQRKGSIIIKAGELSQQFELVQQGMAFALLPYLKFGAGEKEIQDFEHARGSTLFDNKAYPVNHLFREFSYIIYNSGLEYIDGKVNLHKNGSELLLGEDFERFLTDNGYRKTLGRIIAVNNKISRKTFYNEKLNVQIEVERMKNNGLDGPIHIRILPVNTNNSPVLERLEFGFDDFSKHDNLVELIKQWESEHGGIYNEEKSSVGWYPPKIFFDVKDNPDYNGRVYNFRDNSKTQLMSVGTSYINTNYFYFFLPENSRNYLTKEVKSFMKKEGYELIRMDSPNPINTLCRYRFYDSKKQLEIEFSFPGEGELYIEDDDVTVTLSPPQTEYYEYY